MNEPISSSALHKSTISKIDTETLSVSTGEEWCGYLEAQRYLGLDSAISKARIGIEVVRTKETGSRSVDAQEKL